MLWLTNYDENKATRDVWSNRVYVKIDRNIEMQTE